MYVLFAKVSPFRGIRRTFSAVLKQHLYPQSVMYKLHTIYSILFRNTNSPSFILRWVYTSDAVKRCVALSRASQMRVKALAAYLFTSHAGISARQRAPESVARRKMLQSSTVLNFRASRQQFSQSCTGVTN